MFNSITSLFISFMLLSSCNNSAKENKTETKINSPAVSTDTVPTTKTGGDKDENGCITSAGYTWSMVRKECVRLFEKGIKMEPQDPSLDKTLVAYLIFSDDKVRVEIFLPTQKKSIVIRKSSAEGEPNKWANNMLTITEVDRVFSLDDEGKLLYRSTGK